MLFPRCFDSVSLASPRARWERRGRPGRSRRRSLRCECLEDRRLLTITVDTLVDEADGSIDDGDISLRDAIAAAAPDETIDFDTSLDGGTILLTLGELSIDRSMTIDATALPAGLTIDASGNDPTPEDDNGDGSRIFYIDDGNHGPSILVALSGLELTGGDVGTAGGAIRTWAHLTVTNCTISGNSASSDGGGIWAYGDLIVTSSIISGNSTSYSGGGIWADRDVVVSNSTISENWAGHGGGGGVGTFHDVTVTSSTISGNSATGGHGGGVAADGNVTVINSTISGNSVDHSGGFGISVNGDGGGISASGAVTVTSSTISGNSAGQSGGGNSASGDGGGISASGAVTVTSSTISGNSARHNGGGISAFRDVMVTIENSIVAGNTDNGAHPDLAPDTGSLSVRFSLIGDNTGTGLAEAPIGMPDANGNLVGDPNAVGVIDPLLGPLADNGGPTQTHALLPASPAIDAGDPDFMPPPDFDQRSAPYGRVASNRVDIGAHEWQGLAVEILDVTTPRITPVDEVAIQFSGDVSGFDIDDLQLSLNGGLNLLTDGQSLATNDNQTFVLNGLTDITTASGYYTLKLVSSESGIADANGTPLDSGDSIDWAMRRLMLNITVDTLIDEADGSIDDGDISLRDAIAAAAPGETINFDTSLDGGAIVLTLGELAVRRSMTFDATSLPTGLTLDASGNDPTPDEDNGDGSRSFYINDGDHRTDSPVTISGLTLTGGDVRTAGGAIRTWEHLTVTDATIWGNSANGPGGGISASADMTVANSTISGNSAGSGGGGISADGDVMVTNSTISRNSPGGGGGGISAGGNVTVTGCTISDNLVTGGYIAAGGGIRALGTVTITNSEVSRNWVTAQHSGGGGISADGDVTVANSTIFGNSALGYRPSGGGIRSRGNVTVANSTISGNSVHGYGGGISADGNVTVTNSTISGNSATRFAGDGKGGGISALRDVTITIENSIVACNSDGGTHPDLAPGTGTLTVRFSLIGDNTGTGLAEAPVGTPDANGNLIGDPTGMGIVEPMLGPLADNGGPTQTYALLPGSLAIDAGDPEFTLPPHYDQRGAPFGRLVGGRIDMGAVERQVSGDMNFDGVLDFNDIASFVLGLRDVRGYEGQYGVAPGANGDMDGDGDFDFDDIAGFVALLVGRTVAGGSPVVVEPVAAQGGDSYVHQIDVTQQRSSGESSGDGQFRLHRQRVPLRQLTQRSSSWDDTQDRQRSVGQDRRGRLAEDSVASREFSSRRLRAKVKAGGLDLAIGPRGERLGDGELTAIWGSNTDWLERPGGRR